MLYVIFNIFKHVKRLGLRTTGSCHSCHQYNDKIICCLLPGDGVGSELMESVRKVFKETEIPVALEIFNISVHDEASINNAIDAIRRHGLCLKSPFENDEPTFHGPYQNLNVRIRVVLDAYASVAHFLSAPCIKTRHSNIDFFIIREQTEAAYINLEHESVKGVVECLKVVTLKKSMRIAKFAFDYATKLNRKSVMCVHKANIMKLSDGLFLKCCREVSKLYPKISFKSIIVDNAMMQLIRAPETFDVIVTPNLYGNIAINLATGLVGGAGLVPGAAYASDCVIFEPAAHHTFSAAAGKNVANPIAILLCAVAMLRHVNLPEYASLLESSIRHVLGEGKVRTSDIGGHSSTSEFTDAVVERMQRSK